MKTPKKLTLKQIADEFFIDAKAKKLVPETIFHYKRALDCFEKFRENNRNVSDNFLKLTQQNYSEFMLFLDNGKRNSVTINTYLRGFIAILKYSLKKYSAPNINTNLIKCNATKKAVYTEYELTRLIVAPPSDASFVKIRNWAMSCMLIYSGIRTNSLINLKVEDICFFTNTINIPVIKTKEQISLPLTDKIIEVLKTYLAAREKFLKNFNCKFLFLCKRNKKIQRRTLFTALQHYNKACGVHRTGVHIFRNTFARQMLLNGSDAFTLQRWLCHKTISMTMHYVNLYNSDLAKSAKKFNPLENL